MLKTRTVELARSRYLHLLILWPWSLPKSKFATFLLSLKLRNFLWFSSLRGLKLPLQNFTARYLNHTITISLAFSFSQQWCLICWNKFPVTFVFFLFTIYLLTTWQLFICQKPTKNTAQRGPNSVTHRFWGPKFPKKKDRMGSIPIIMARWIIEPQ